MGPYPASHWLRGSVSVLMGGTPCSHCLVFPLFAREYRAAGNVEHQLDERPGSSLCAGQQPRWTSWCSSFPGPCPAVLPPWERRAPARWAAWFKPLCWPAASLDELVLVLPRPGPGRASLLGTSSTSSMGGLVQASVLASSLAGRAGARPSQARARSCFPPGNVEHQLDERPGSGLCAGQQPRWTSWCSSFPGPCPVVLPSWERRAPARWAAWFKPLCWPAASLDELVLVPQGNVRLRHPRDCLSKA